MEYIKKEELIKGEIYKASNESLTYIMKATKNLYNVINIPSYNEFMKSGNFNGSYLTFINATSEEKHWLNTCIEQDKFITFEEVMKTFIPEYVEAIQQSDGYTIGKIYKTLSDSTKEWYRNIDDKNRENGWSYLNFKPSTKEAYDAQFVVKDVFILPEKWYLKITDNNKNIINNWRRNIIRYDNSDCKYETISKDGSGSSIDFITQSKTYTEITSEQFKKYVLKEETAIEFGNKIDKEIIEPLPQFKIIESVETITKVENNEGNQFFIGDVVISSNGTVQTIESFNYNKSKTNIIAFTNKQSILGNGIGIDKIEHYIEPKVEVKDEFILPEKWCIKNTDDLIGEFFNFKIVTECYTKVDHKNCYLHSFDNSNNNILKSKCNANVSSSEIRDNFTEITFDQFKKYVLKEEVKEETLLEKAKRLYPVGTRVKTATGNNFEIIIKDQSKFKLYLNNNISVTENYMIYLYCSYENKWANIIE